MESFTWNHKKICRRFHSKIYRAFSGNVTGYIWNITGSSIKYDIKENFTESFIRNLVGPFYGSFTGNFIRNITGNIIGEFTGYYTGGLLTP